MPIFVDSRGAAAPEANSSATAASGPRGVQYLLLEQRLDLGQRGFLGLARDADGSRQRDLAHGRALHGQYTHILRHESVYIRLTTGPREHVPFQRNGCQESVD